MHNFVLPTFSIDELFVDVKRGLHSPKKEFMALNEIHLKALYHNYDVLARNDELSNLKPHWVILPGEDEELIDSKKESQRIAYNLYGSDRPFVNAHWEAITKANGGETLYCPICGLHECEEMDHFVPREESLFPEYSAHLSNLIPLCHNCNNKKGTKFLDDAGDRIFFNAYFDQLTSRNILSCCIDTSDLDGSPQIETNLDPSLSESRKPDKYILATISELHLLERFQSKARLWFKTEMSRLSSRAGQKWDMIRAELESVSSPTEGNPDIVYPAVMKAIAESLIMEMWFDSLGDTV